MPQLFTPTTLAWFAGISETNTREYYQEHKEEYETAVREPFTSLLDELSHDFGGTPHVFRPNRDVRFSSDKSLYKTNISGYIRDRSGTASAAYAELSLNGLFAATGYYQMAADQLERYRRTLTDPEASTIGMQLRQALADATQAGYEISGEHLKTAPRGIDKNAENIDLLKYKSIAISRRLPLNGSLEDADALRFVRSTWNAGKVVGQWLDRYVGASTVSQSQR